MNLISIPALKDNYIWILKNNKKHCLVIDPGEAEPVLITLKKNKWKPEAIFLTHHHYDHINGVKELLSFFPDLVVYGPQEVNNRKIPIKIVSNGDNIFLSNRKFSVILTPGHTLGHVCFFSSPYLFCGDTLFSGGCGKLLEGTPYQMYQSLKKINQLPDNTLICCSHENTLSNMKFSVSILPNETSIVNYFLKVNQLRKRKQKTLPVTLKNEKIVNLFLRTDDSNLIGKILPNFQFPEERFAWLRKKKDTFK